MISLASNLIIVGQYQISYSHFSHKYVCQYFSMKTEKEKKCINYETSNSLVYQLWKSTAHYFRIGTVCLVGACGGPVG